MNRFTARFFSAIFGLSLVAALSLGTARSHAQGNSGDIQQAMTADEFRAAGLEKLSPGELEKLNAWLKGDRQKAAQKATAKIRDKTLTSRIDGNYDGASSGQIITLEDGTSWRVGNNNEQHGGHADHPDVTLFKTIFGWKMRIHGMAEFYVVPVEKH